MPPPMFCTFSERRSAVTVTTSTPPLPLFACAKAALAHIMAVAATPKLSAILLDTSLILLPLASGGAGIIGTRAHARRCFARTIGVFANRGKFYSALDEPEFLHC